MNQEKKSLTRPFDYLNEAIDKTVYIRVKEEKEVRGKLVAFDVHMNIVLEDAEELQNGELRKKIGKMILRGDNILYISP